MNTITYLMGLFTIFSFTYVLGWVMVEICRTYNASKGERE